MAETFHTNGETPSTLTANDGVSLSTGLYFTLGVDGTITHARWYASPSVTGTVKWGLYRLSDSAQLGVQSFSSYTAGAWNTIALTSSISVTAATRYAAVYWSPNYYVATGSYFGSAITRGDITAEMTGGRFTEPDADISIPTNSFSNGCYFVDFQFTPNAGGSTVSPSGIATPAAVGTPTVAQSLAVAPGGISIPVAVGTPTVSGQPYVPPTPTESGQGSWWNLKGILDGTRTILGADRQRGWYACPNDGEPLRRTKHGVLYCPFDNWQPPDQ